MLFDKSDNMNGLIFNRFGFNITAFSAQYDFYCTLQINLYEFK